MGCRRADDKSALVRIVSLDGAYIIDVAQTAPGRGAYLHPGCGALALRRRAIPRALHVAGGSSGQLASLVAAVDAGASAEATGRPFA